MDDKVRQMISKELEQFHCSILLDEVKEKVRKLKTYGMADLYLRLRPYGMSERVMHSIEDVTNPMLNSINEKCARIRKVFAGVLPQGVARYYSISGKRGEAKKIDLVRTNVVWECNLSNSQAL